MSMSVKLGHCEAYNYAEQDWKPATVIHIDNAVRDCVVIYDARESNGKLAVAVVPESCIRYPVPCRPFTSLDGYRSNFPKIGDAILAKQDDKSYILTGIDVNCSAQSVHFKLYDGFGYEQLSAEELYKRYKTAQQLPLGVQVEKS